MRSPTTRCPDAPPERKTHPHNPPNTRPFPNLHPMQNKNCKSLFLQMLGASRRALSLLQGSQLTAPINGQDSVAKLVYAPLAFLSFRTETTTLAGILASAVAFLEGYSADEMETDLDFVANDDVSIVARSHLRLVPYRTAPPALNSVSTPRIAPETVLDLSHLSHTTPTTVYHEVSISSVRSSTDAVGHSSLLTPEEQHVFNQYKGTFQTAPLFCDAATQSLLETSTSPELARAVFRCFAETGLVVQPEVVFEMMRRFDKADPDFLRAIVTQLEAECDLGLLHHSPFPTALDLLPAPQSPAVNGRAVSRRGRFDAVRADRHRRGKFPQ